MIRHSHACQFMRNCWLQPLGWSTRTTLIRKALTELLETDTANVSFTPWYNGSFSAVTRILGGNGKMALGKGMVKLVSTVEEGSIVTCPNWTRLNGVPLEPTRTPAMSLTKPAM